jgi:hypothetical protein
MNMPTLVRMTYEEHGRFASNPDRYAVAGSWEFSPDMWAPAIQELVTSETASETISSLGELTFGLAALYNHFYRKGPKHVEASPSSMYSRARFRYTQQAGGRLAVGSLKSMKLPGINIGLPTPEHRNRNAYAVVESVVRSKGCIDVLQRDVIHEPNAPSTDLLRTAAQRMAIDACEAFDTRYPDFVQARLAELGVELVDIE